MSGSPSRRRRPARNPRRAPKPTEGVTLFGVVPAPGELPAIEPVARPTAFVESLDPLPLRGHHFVAQYVAAVVERAAGLAIALTAAAELNTSPVLRDPDAREGEPASDEDGTSAEDS